MKIVHGQTKPSITAPKTRKLTRKEELHEKATELAACLRGRSGLSVEYILEFEEREEHVKLMKKVAAKNKAAVVPDGLKLTHAPATNVVSMAEEIAKFKHLLDIEAITHDEFAAKKKQLLAM